MALYNVWRVWLYGCMARRGLRGAHGARGRAGHARTARGCTYILLWSSVSMSFEACGFVCGVGELLGWYGAEGTSGFCLDVCEFCYVFVRLRFLRASSLQPDGSYTFESFYCEPARGVRSSPAGRALLLRSRGGVRALGQKGHAILGTMAFL